MIHSNYFWGMHYIWWVVWVLVLFWIFVAPFNIPGQRRRSASSLDLLRMRLASGQITPEQYRHHRQMLIAGEMKA